MIDFPYTVGYGMTECGPIICYEDWKRFKPGSCGKAALNMEVKVLSPDPGECGRLKLFAKVRT